MNTCENCAIVRSFSSNSVLSPKLLFFSEKSRNVGNSPFNKSPKLKYLVLLPVLKFQISVFQKIFPLITQRSPQRNNIVWKLACGYCLSYCKIYSLVPDSEECIHFFSPNSAVHYFYHLKSNNIVGQRKTNNTEKYLYASMIDFVQLKNFLYIANTCKQQRFTVNTVHLLYKLAESHIMPRTN